MEMNNEKKIMGNRIRLSAIEMARLFRSAFIKMLETFIFHVNLHTQK